MDPKPTKYCVIHQIETDSPNILVLTSNMRKAIRAVVKDVQRNEAYTYTKKRIKKDLRRDHSFHAGLGDHDLPFDNWYIISYPTSKV